ncbi:MAG: metalloregulator ArsR/SmtB family transcription factor [Actinomycetota bacterium]
MNDVFAVLGDPTRRSILERLSGDGPATATLLADEIGISRQAVAKHLNLLADVGLAVSERRGRETVFRAELGALDAVGSWLDRVQGEWKLRLDRLARRVESG